MKKIKIHICLILLTAFSVLAIPANAGAAPVDALLPFAMAGMVVNKSNLSILFQAFKSAFNNGFRDASPQWQKIATLVPSTTSEEKYGWLGQWPRLREWLGDRQVKNLALHDYSIKNKKFESTIAVGKDDIDDDSYGVFTPLMQEMGFAAATHPDELIFGLLADGFTELCFDGQYFFDTDHDVDGSSVSNMQAGSEDPWFLMDVRRALKPLIFQSRKDYDFKAMTNAEDENVFMRDEFRYGIDSRSNVGFGFWQTAFGSKAVLDSTNFDAAFAAMLALQSDEGRPLGIIPNILVCGPSNRAAAASLLEAQLIGGGNSNTNYKAVELLVVPWLT